MATRSAAAQKVEEPLSDDELRDAEQRVLHPELDTTQGRLGHFKADLKPLPIRQAKRLAELTNPAFKRFSDQATPQDFTFDAMTDVVQALIGSAAIVASWYQLAGCNSEYIEEACTVDEVREFLEAQLNLCGRNDFLLVGLRSLLMAGRRVAESLVDLAEGPSTPAKDSSTPASAKPGESALLTSASDTPPAS